VREGRDAGNAFLLALRKGSWGHAVLRDMLGAVGVLGDTWEALGDTLEALGDALGALGHIWWLLWHVLVTVRGLVGALWRLMDALWGPCGGSWGHVGRSWGRFRRTLGALGKKLVASPDTGGIFLIMFGHFVQPLRKHSKKHWFSMDLEGTGCIAGTLWGSWGHFDGSWEHFWGTLGALGDTLGAFRGTLGAFRSALVYFGGPSAESLENTSFLKLFEGPRGRLQGGGSQRFLTLPQRPPTRAQELPKYAKSVPKTQEPPHCPHCASMNLQSASTSPRTVTKTC